MGRARGNQFAAALSSDAFAGVVGNRRGSGRGDPNPAHEQLRVRALAANGHTISVSGLDGKRRTVRPLQVSSADWTGYRSFSPKSGYFQIVTGELCVDPQTEEWVALVRTGSLDSRSASIAAHGPALDAVLTELHRVMGIYITPADSPAAGADAPLTPMDAEKAFITPAAVRARLQYLAGLRC